MESYVLLIIPLIAAVAFYIKGLTGFGPALIFIPLGALIISPQPVIVASSFLDLLAGLIMLRTVQQVKRYSFLTGIIVAMAAGTVAGVYLLSVVPSETLRFLLGGLVLFLGVWFALFRMSGTQEQRLDQLPDRCNKKDLGYSILAGLSGGFFGISGPPVIWHLGRRFQMAAFRDVLIVVFVFAAIVRILLFTAAGLVTLDSMKVVALAIPGLLAGLLLGNRAFLTINEVIFSRVVGTILILLSIMLIL
ncbi:TSUP family transporter [Balneolaceae bacterium ANBcel3]|nr:TSUP family transporter [Balneolaceae bacterium ANBcel3]